MGLYPPPDTPLQLWLTQSAMLSALWGGSRLLPQGRGAQLLTWSFLVISAGAATAQ